MSDHGPKCICVDCEGKLTALTAENERLKRERDRYRTALEAISKSPHHLKIGCVTGQDGEKFCSEFCPVGMARRALTSTTPPAAEPKRPACETCALTFEQGYTECADCGRHVHVAAAPPVALRPARLTPQQIAKMVARNFDFAKESNATWFVFQAALAAAKQAYVEADRAAQPRGEKL